MIWKVPLMDSVTALASVLTLASCGGSEGERLVTAASVTDSAGIEIVYSPGPTWEPGASWSISEAPCLTIGTAGGDEAYTLYGVRAAIRLNDGRIAIANQGTSQVRIYDGSGRHLQDIGRSGEGPGEFRLLMDIWRGGGDSIVAADNRLARLTVFDGQGQVGRTIQLEQSETPRQIFGRRTLEDGSILVSGAVLPSEPPRLGLFDGGMRQFDRYSSEGEPLNRVGTLPQGKNWGFDSGNPFGPSYTTAPFTIFSPPHASDGESVFLGDGTRAEVGQWSPSGDLRRIVRWGVEPRPVTSELEEGYRAMRLKGADTPELLQAARAMLDGLPFPDHLPIYETLIADSEGYLWIKPYALQWEEGRVWWVFDHSGRWLGEAMIPTGLNILEVGADYILGRTRDEQGVERVVMYDLDRGADA